MKRIITVPAFFAGLMFYTMGGYSFAALITSSLLIQFIIIAIPAIVIIWQLKDDAF
jgi:hypothetical protein